MGFFLCQLHLKSKPQRKGSALVTVAVLAIPVSTQVPGPRSPRRAGAQPRSPDVRLGALPCDCAVTHLEQAQPSACPSVFLLESWFLERAGRHLVICTPHYRLVPSPWHGPSSSFLENQSPSYYSYFEACLFVFDKIHQKVLLATRNILNILKAESGQLPENFLLRSGDRERGICHSSDVTELVFSISCILD